ncbi:MAG: multidrug efflux SMR transporter [Rhodospirillales bacterium]|nr:multidrug efflux SMR transporter [Rhodospirillales bacterium]
MAWMYLALAALFEIGWAIGLKQAAKEPGVAVWGVTVAAMVASVVFLGLAVRELPLGTAYAIWTGVGTAGVFLAGVILFGESADVLRVLCVAAILGGVFGLKLLSA